MKGLTFLLLFPSALGVSAQGTPKTTLWRITHAESVAPSYLFGTVHSRDDRAFQWGDSLVPALARVQMVAGELDLERDKAQLLGVMSLALLPSGKTLKDLYRKREWRRVEAGLRAKLGIAQGMTHKLKPFFVLLMIAGNEVSGPHERVLDEELLHRARENGKEVIGLETMREQIVAMDVLSLERQAELLLQYIETGGADDELDRMLDAYALQDLDALMEVMDASRSIPTEMDASLIVERNHRMAHRMDSILHTGTTAFFAVGSAHLPRAEGLIELMRARGYMVEPVFSDYTKPKDVTPPGEDDKD